MRYRTLETTRHTIGHPSGLKNGALSTLPRSSVKNVALNGLHATTTASPTPPSKVDHSRRDRKLVLPV